MDAGDLIELWELKKRCPRTFHSYLQRDYPQLGYDLGNHSFALNGVSILVKLKYFIEIYYGEAKHKQ